MPALRGTRGPRNRHRHATGSARRPTAGRTSRRESRPRPHARAGTGWRGRRDDARPSSVPGRREGGPARRGGTREPVAQRRFPPSPPPVATVRSVHARAGRQRPQEDVAEHARAESPVGSHRSNDRVTHSRWRDLRAVGVRAVQNQTLHALGKRCGEGDCGAASRTSRRGMSRAPGRVRRGVRAASPLLRRWSSPTRAPRGQTSRRRDGRSESGCTRPRRLPRIAESRCSSSRVRDGSPTTPVRRAVARRRAPRTPRAGRREDRNRISELSSIEMSLRPAVREALNWDSHA